jgi:hypothetical protein
MKEETVAGDVSQAEKGAPRAERRRFSIPMIVAAVIMFLAMAGYFVNGVFLLLDLTVFGNGIAGIAARSGALTEDWQRLVLAGVYLFFGTLALVVLAGFLLRRQRAWSAAMTWTAISLAVNLVVYFVGQPRFLSMLAGVVLLLVLNQASVHREFRLEER